MIRKVPSQILKTFGGLGLISKGYNECLKTPEDPLKPLGTVPTARTSLSALLVKFRKCWVLVW